MKKITISIFANSYGFFLSGCTSAQMTEPDRSQCLRKNSTDFDTYNKARGQR
jgi:hypothetical protein